MTTYSISPTSPSISENAGSETFTVTRSNTSQSATVYVSTVQDQGSSNTNNEFYNGLSNDQITFAAGQASVQVPLTINDAHLTSGSETFRLIVQQNPTDPVTTSLASDNFTILNNDSGGGNSNEGIDYRSKSSTSSSLTGIDVPAMKSDGYSFVGEYIGSASNQGYLTSADVSVLAQQN